MVKLSYYQMYYEFWNKYKVYEKNRGCSELSISFYFLFSIFCFVLWLAPYIVKLTDRTPFTAVNKYK